jgi:hypothetical protein
VIDACAKDYLHGDLRSVRETMLWKLDGLSEYDARRPMTATGTNLLGLVKHLTVWELRYFGEVFDRPPPVSLPRWDDDAVSDSDEMWVTERETRAEIVEGYRRACEHADATIDALPVDAPGHVPWWPRPDVTLFNVLVHVLTETTRHAGHADILREQIDGTVGTDPDDPPAHGHDATHWAERRATIEQAARGVR